MIRLSPPIAGMKLSRSPLGSITQFFAENLNGLYAKLGLNGHNGLDIYCPTRTPVLAAHDGVVERVFNETNTTFTRGYGIHLRHLDGYWTVYWHMLPPNVTVGQKFKVGDCMGYSDNSGDSTGPHLHFGLYPAPMEFNEHNGFRGALDPLPYLRIGILQKIVGLFLKVLELKGR